MSEAEIDEFLIARTLLAVQRKIGSFLLLPPLPLPLRSYTPFPFLCLRLWLENLCALFGLLDAHPSICFCSALEVGLL